MLSSMKEKLGDSLTYHNLIDWVSIQPGTKDPWSEGSAARSLPSDSRVNVFYVSPREEKVITKNISL